MPQASVSKRAIIAKSVMKIILYSDANEAHYHKTGFSLSLVLEVRVFGTWKSETTEQ